MSLVHERSLPKRASTDIDEWLGCSSENTFGLITRLEQEVRKHEQEARLAAEIGQTLLHNQEFLKRETQEAKKELEKKTERANYLERVVTDQDQVYQDLLEEHHKVIWENRKTGQTLQETVEDLDVANQRNMQLSNELKALHTEVEKLRTFKVNANKREEGMRAKLDDMKQELVVARKAELSLESQQKKLKTRYETLSGHYERLKINSSRCHSDSHGKDDVAWLREYNERLRSDMLKLTTLTVEPPNLEDHQPHHLIHFVRELVVANNKLKSDLLLLTSQHQQQQQQQFDEHQTLAGTLEHFLHGETMANKYIAKLQGTDMRLLNRQRHQPFDIAGLAETSNTMIQALLDKIDLDGMPPHNAALLSEVGHLRMALNDMQCEYVRKVEEHVVAATVKTPLSSTTTTTTTTGSHHEDPSSTVSGAFGWLMSMLPLPLSSSLAFTTKH